MIFQCSGIQHRSDFISPGSNEEKPSLERVKLTLSHKVFEFFVIPLFNILYF
jgi:hypothetical protein